MYVTQRNTEDLTVENRALTVLASAVRAASNNSADQKNRNATGLHLIIDVTAVPGVDTVTFVIKGKDPLSGKYYTVLSGSAISATGTTVLKMFPGFTNVANSVANDVLPADWRVEVTHSAATNFTYSVGAQLIR